MLQQQVKFDDFLTCYNEERDQALDMRYPAELYQPSLRPYRGLGDLDYPFHDRDHGHPLRAHPPRQAQDQPMPGFCRSERGIKKASDRIWLVTFTHYDPGFFEHETCRLEPLADPFEPKVLPMSPV